MIKKGFTLIELLAVILILGVLALIAVPTVNRLLLETKNNSFIQTVENIASTVENRCSINSITGRENINEYNFTNGEVDNNIGLSGRLPDNGQISVDNNCDVSLVLSRDDICAYKEYNGEIELGTMKNGICTVNHSQIIVNPEETDPVCFGFDESTGTITSFDFNNEACGTEVVIPNTINNVPVTTIGKLAFYRDEDHYSDSQRITILVLNDNLVTIDDNAFRANDIQNNLVIPKSVKSIGAHAFQYNPSLTYVNIKGSEVIGDQAFYETSLSKVYLPSGLRELSSTTFYKTLLEEIVLPSSLETIGSKVFYGTLITSVDIPRNVQTIGDQAFYEATLNTVNFNDVVTNIGNYAFQYNYLTEVDIPDSVTTLGVYAFADNNLSSIRIGTGITKLLEEVFASNNLTSVNIPSNITSIHKYAFCSNTSLSNITVDKKKGSISSSPWCAHNATVNWAS